MTRVLCLHGLGGTGATMWPVVAACIDAGFTALAPTLPGHGTDPDDLVGVTWNDWLVAARDWPADVVVGQSLGASLALQLAAEERCHAVVCINPVAPDADALEGLQWRHSRGHEWVDVDQHGVDEVAYSRLPISSLMEMMEGVAGIDLAAVTQPVLLITSAGNDSIDGPPSDMIAAVLPQPPRRVLLDRSGHVATLDVQRHVVQRAVVDFVSGSTGSHLTRGR
jgi:carboxylesterase